MAPRPPAVGWVRIDSTDPPTSVTARLFDRPDVQSGYGGWQEVARPRRRPLTTWQGSPALRMTLPILLDRFADGLSIERPIAQIERLGTPVSAAGEPPIVRLRASGAALPYQERAWVVDSITFGDGLMNASGNRTRQQLTLSLLEHVADVLLAESAAGRRRRQVALRETQHGASAKRIVARRASSRGRASPHALAVGGDFGMGEDLLSIAARELGDADRWVEIAQLNDIRDPRTITPGQVLRLP